MSFLGLYRDPIVAEVTRRCDWRIADLVEAERPASLYLVVPPSDISRTKPLVRLVLNQIGRRLTEKLRRPKRSAAPPAADAGRVPGARAARLLRDRARLHGRLWRQRFLIAQSLNQIEKAYGANNAILDNCHVRVAFATNDERTAKRVSDALGTATELRAMKNYAGHRLAPWLGHLMVSRQETARPLLTAGRGDAAAAERRACAGLRLVARSARRRRATTRTCGSTPASFHHPRWPSPARAPPAVDPIRELTTGAISRFQRQSRMRLGRSPALSSRRIPIMVASVASRHYPITKRSRPRSRSPAQSSHSPMRSLMITSSMPDHCASVSARWRDRRRSIQMTEFRSKDRL